MEQDREGLKQTCGTSHQVEDYYHIIYIDMGKNANCWVKKTMVKTC